MHYWLSRVERVFLGNPVRALQHVFCFMTRSGFKTPSNLNLRPARTYDYKADRKESFDEPPHIRTN